MSNTIGMTEINAVIEFLVILRLVII
jgi:hypothetical protein